MSKAKHWCFTLNNYTQDDIDRLNRIGDLKECSYLCFGKEIGEQGTKHLQGFISYNDRKSLSQLRKHVHDKAHFEIARGTPNQAAEYCQKDGDFVEHGLLPKPKGTRNDLLAVQRRILEGADRDTIRDEFFNIYAKYPRAIETYISDLQPKRNWETNVVVFWGKTGKGKTRSVYEFIKHEEIYSHPGEQWFDGYKGQSVVLFDDFNGSEFKLCYLLKLLDRYPMQVPIKGGYVNWVPKHIYFTSNKDPTTWYENAFEEHRNALFRRIKLIKEFN